MLDAIVLASQPPELYRRFIEDAKRLVAELGLSWDIPLDGSGVPLRGADWDLRNLMRTRERSGAYFNTFAVDTVARDAAIADGYGVPLPVGPSFDSDLQDFIKAMACAWAEDGVSARQVRDYVKNLRTVLSLLPCRPWEISTANLDAVVSYAPNSLLGKHVRRIGALINSRLLSVCVPLVLPSETKTTPEQLKSLSDRKSSWKLPSRGPLHELFRICVQEAPQNHFDAVRFAMTRILYMTGLRLEEIEWLPADCLRWTRHEDFLTGKPAGEVGGVTWTLTLRYFGVKSSKGSRDLLVEQKQEVPERFQKLLVETVEWMLELTQPLRYTLARQRLEPEKYKQSSLMTYSTTHGEQVGYEDLLFLVVKGSWSSFATEVALDAPISLISRSAFYGFLGVGGNLERSGIFRYGDLSSEEVTAVRPHSLRHLLNSELFRQEVADTIITKHFNRESVKQTHVYNHDSLEEILARITLPQSAYKFVRADSTAEAIAKGVSAGLYPTSHIAKSFRLIQDAHGDDAAFAYLAANVDGFHKTPYGFCVNSFAMNPCPKHLQCFNNCRHFAPSGDAKHSVKLQDLRDELKRCKEAASRKPVSSAGRKNQLADLDKKIHGVEMALLGTPGVPIFPDGDDLSTPKKDVFS